MIHYAYELAVIVQDGLRRMYRSGKCFYYITCMTKTTRIRDAGRRGAGHFERHVPAAIGGRGKVRVTCLFGTILREVLAAELLEKTMACPDVYSVTASASCARMPRDRALEHAAFRRAAQADYIQQACRIARPLLPRRLHENSWRSNSAMVPGGTQCWERMVSAAAIRARVRRFFEVDRHYVVGSAQGAVDEARSTPDGEQGMQTFASIRKIQPVSV